MQTGVALEAISGMKSRDKAISNCLTYEWPESLFMLFVLEVGDFVWLTAKSKTVDTKALAAMEVKHRREVMELVQTILQDQFMHSQVQGPDLRHYFFQALDSYVDKGRNPKRLRSVKQFYEDTRGFVQSMAPGVHMNYNYDENKLARGKGRVPKVQIGKRKGRSTRGGGSSRDYLTNSIFKTICARFNSKKGCPAGKECDYEHKCVGCKARWHGCWDCKELRKHYQKMLKSTRQSNSGGAGTKRGYGDIIMKKEVVDAVQVSSGGSTITVNGITYVATADKK